MICPVSLILKRKKWEIQKSIFSVWNIIKYRFFSCSLTYPICYSILAKWYSCCLESTIQGRPSQFRVNNISPRRGCHNRWPFILQWWGSERHLSKARVLLGVYLHKWLLLCQCGNQSRDAALSSEGWTKHRSYFNSLFSS